MENLGFEIRKQVTRYLARESGISEFHAGIMPLVWNIENRTDPIAASLGRDIELLLAELSHGDWTEEEVKARLAPVVNNYVVREGVAATSWSGSAAGETKEVELSLSESGQSQVQTQFVDIQLAEAS